MMKQGDKGEAVKSLQRALTIAGFSCQADGIFGPGTESQLRKFQHSRGLTVDGMAGNNTLSALKSPTFKPRETVPVPLKLQLRSVTDRLARAWFWSTQKAKYILGEGGRKPSNDSPLTPDKNGTLGSDCVGWVLWALGVDRYQPELFTYYDGWMNTDSIIADAKTKVGGGLWKLLAKPEPGCLVIFPSLYSNGKMTRMGHVGLVVEIPGEWPDDIASWSAKERTNLLKQVKVIDCNASLARRLTGKAIGATTAAALWNKPDAVWVGWAG